MTLGYMHYDHTLCNTSLTFRIHHFYDHGQTHL